MDKINLEHVGYIYNAGTPFETVALEDVNLGIREGRITGIIGHTGSGKSTMMQLFNGLVKPTSGRVLLDGVDIHAGVEELLPLLSKRPEFIELRGRKLKKAVRAEMQSRRRTLCFRVGLVMQYPEYQLFEETVEKDIGFGPRNIGLSDSEIAERVKEAAAFTGIGEELFQKSPFDLSGGQKRRVAIAGVIAMRPEVLVLDEPAAGLDPRGREGIFRGISEYQRATGSTVIIVSHSMEDMAGYCDDTVVMSGARVAFSGTRGEVFSHVSELCNIGLDIPEITRLMRELSSRGFPVRQDCYTVEEAMEALRPLLDAKGGIPG